MTTSQRMSFYCFIAMISLGLLTYANYQRYVEQRAFFVRAQASTQKCLELKKEIEQLKQLPEDFPFLLSSDISAQNDLKSKLNAASIASAKVDIQESLQLGESSYKVKIVSINFGANVGLPNLLEFVNLATGRNKSALEGPQPRYLLNSLRVEDSKPGPVDQGQVETWRCAELTLSYISKTDKSP